MPETRKIAIRYNHACALGFPSKLQEFEEAYKLGFSQLAKPMRDRLVCSFVAAYYVATLNGGLSERQQRYEAGIRHWILVNKDCERKRTWLGYINGDRSFSKHPPGSGLRAIGWKQPVQKDPDLSTEHSGLIEIKKRWISSANARKLAEYLDQITRDRKSSPISNLVCLGSGVGKDNIQVDIARIMVVLEIVKQLVLAKSGMLYNLFVQNPEMTPGMRYARFPHKNERSVRHWKFPS